MRVYRDPASGKSVEDIQVFEDTAKALDDEALLEDEEVLGDGDGEINQAEIDTRRATAAAAYPALRKAEVINALILDVVSGDEATQEEIDTVEELEVEADESHKVVGGVLTLVSAEDLATKQADGEAAVEAKAQAIRDATTIAGLKAATLDYLGLSA